MRADVAHALKVALFVVLLAGCTKRLKLSLVDDEADAADPNAKNAPATPATATATATATDTSGGPGALATNTATAPAGKAATPAPAPAQYPATCAGTCEKALKCKGAYNATEQASCVQSCEAGPQAHNTARFADLNRKDCASMLAALGMGGGSSSGGAKPAAPQGGCNDCATCVFDGTSCYSRVPPFLACDACCCRKGGPAPRWE